MSNTPPRPSQFALGGLWLSTHSIDELLYELNQLLHFQDLRPRSILCANAHIFNLAWSDSLLRSDMNAARIVTADGMSIVWFGRLFGGRLRYRCNMTEAFSAFLEASDFAPCRGVLVGLHPNEGSIAARSMMEHCGHLTISEVCSGYLEEEQYKEYFSRLKDIDIILVGMGTPRTERICRIASEACPDAVVWGIGAGTIRIFAGTMREAPPFMRRTGTQWLHRLWTEPRQLWKRYVFGNPAFILRVLSLAFRNRPVDISEGHICESDSQF